jgi:hypothetical protein
MQQTTVNEGLKLAKRTSKDARIAVTNFDCTAETAPSQQECSSGGKSYCFPHALEIRQDNHRTHLADTSHDA